MKYQVKVRIDLPLEQCIDKLNNPDNMKHWQEGLVSYKHVSGDQGEEGAKMELTYMMGKRSITMVETILKQDFPHELHATYDAKGVHNIQRNYFKAIDENTTEWLSDTEFQFSGWFMKVLGTLMPGTFKKQSEKYLKDFKEFAEKGISVAEK